MLTKNSAVSEQRQLVSPFPGAKMLRCRLTDFMIIHGARPTDTVRMTVGDANGKD